MGWILILVVLNVILVYLYWSLGRNSDKTNLELRETKEVLRTQEARHKEELSKIIVLNKNRFGELQNQCNQLHKKLKLELANHTETTQELSNLKTQLRRLLP